MKNILWIAIGGLLLNACAQNGSDSTNQKPDDRGDAYEKEADGKADAWNRRNNPAGLRVELNKSLAELPMEGEAENRAWPDTYWPTYKDSVNARWQSTGSFLDDLSPAEKYDAAFNGWNPFEVETLRPFDAHDCKQDSFDAEYYENLGPLAAYVSQYKGNRKTREAALAGSLQDSCRAKEDGECVLDCGEEPEELEEKGVHRRCVERCNRGGIETWWGLCHAWAPAAILEKEPLHPVTIPTEFGDITFEVGDIKALFALTYDRSSATLIGGRCNDFDVKRDDKTGRIINEDCRDLNAGAFHVAMTNLLGLQKRGFVEDRTFDYEVWNQPVKGYDITTMEEITIAEAHRLLHVDPDNPTDCVPGFNEATDDGEASEASDDGETSEASETREASEYCYNSNIDALFKVETTLHWLTESSASTLALGTEHMDRYSRTDRYTYILEVRDGEVVGGEWYGGSILNHPDFVWLPFAPRVTFNDLSLNSVRMLNRLAQSTPAERAAVMAPVELKSGEVALMIPDNQPTGVNHTLTVDDAKLDTRALEVSLTVNITHSYSGDLKISIRSPSGEDFVLSDRQGGATADIKKSFAVPYEGPMNGEWTLEVSDLYRRDIGMINSWQLTFTDNEGDSLDAPEVFAFESTRSATIPDNEPNGVMSYIDIDEIGAINKLSVDLKVTHTYIGDLTITLKKGGVSQVIHNREGGSEDNLIRSFETEAFKGMEMSGRWYLTIVDSARHDSGTRDGWTIKVTK